MNFIETLEKLRSELLAIDENPIQILFTNRSLPYLRRGLYEYLNSRRKENLKNAEMMNYNSKIRMQFDLSHVINLTTLVGCHGIRFRSMNVIEMPNTITSRDFPVIRTDKGVQVSMSWEPMDTMEVGSLLKIIETFLPGYSGVIEL